MKKGVAVPYIVALLLAVGVIGLVGYWFVASGGKFGSSATEQDCRTKLSEWCAVWGSTNGYGTDTVTGDPKSPIKKFGTSGASPECSEFLSKLVPDRSTTVEGLTGSDYRTSCT